MDNTVKKATTSLNFLKRNLSACPTLVKDKCYKSLVRTIMENASCVWDTHTQWNINKLEMAQRRAARSSRATLIGLVLWQHRGQISVGILSKTGGCKASQSCSTELYTTWLLSLPFHFPYQQGLPEDTTRDCASYSPQWMHTYTPSSRAQSVYMYGTSCQSMSSQHPACRPSSSGCRSTPCTSRSSTVFFSL